MNTTGYLLYTTFNNLHFNCNQINCIKCKNVYNKELQEIKSYLIQNNFNEYIFTKIFLLLDKHILVTTVREELNKIIEDILIKDKDNNLNYRLLKLYFDKYQYDIDFFNKLIKMPNKTKNTEEILHTIGKEFNFNE